SASTCEEVSESCSSCSAPEITTNNRGGSRRGSSNPSPACTLRRRPIASRRANCAAVNLGESFGPSKSRSAGLVVAVGPLGLASTGTVVTYGYLATRVARALRQLGESLRKGYSEGTANLPVRFAPACAAPGMTAGPAQCIILA